MASATGRLFARRWRVRPIIRQGTRLWRRISPADVPHAGGITSCTCPANAAGHHRSITELLQRAWMSARSRLPRSPDRRRNVGRRTRRGLPGRSSARAHLRVGARWLHNAMSSTCWRFLPTTGTDSDRCHCRKPTVRRRKSLSPRIVHRGPRTVIRPIDQV